MELLRKLWFAIRPRRRFFTADLHLRHKNVIKYANRPFNSLEEMEETLINNWNRIVAPKDYVYVLGDICMGQLHSSLEVTRRLNGKIILILGNHDRPSKMYPHKTDERRAEFMKVYLNYFFEVLDELVIEIDGRSSLLTHLPYYNPNHLDRANNQKEPRFVDVMPKDTGLWHLHGHCHSKLSDILNIKEIDVGVDGHNYTPWSEGEIIKIMRAQERDYAKLSDRE